MSEVRVLLVMRAQAELREFAVLANAPQKIKIRHAPETLPDYVTVDKTFAPVPLGRIGHTPRLALSTTARSPEFVIRATVPRSEIASLTRQEGVEVYSDPKIAPFSTCPGDPAVGSAKDVAKAIDVAKLADMGCEGSKVAIAIMDTGINLAHLKKVGAKVSFDSSVSWSPSGVSGKPGKHPVHHGTMCAYDALIAAPKATLLDFPILLSTTSGASGMDGFLSDALQAYSYLMMTMRSSDWKYSALVVNNSWGMYHESWDFPKGHSGRYADNPNHPFNIIVGTLARAGADILFAAGNCGSPCPDARCEGVTKNTIMGANAHPDVITVAGATVKKRRVGYSSQGPAIPGMKHSKPDLTAYTHFAGSQAFGADEPDSGTSAACPVAAGCVAAIRSRVAPSKIGAGDLSRELRSDATQPTGPTGWNKNYGYGIINAVGTAMRLLPSA
ncbi:S8 family serine peptidase [Hyphomicrobium sp. xq]|uniref:S8 family serine peptidase n=1 Tax=Hyphomicrobium album TaxID=2665159 RepID=A0A6I3KIE0_9HYPH|nr:S8/S53 family peptidase [Hyphomicrobium album]MTD93492.1 S8 family serine peptidase [Hyphomicrobium album]